MKKFQQNFNTLLIYIVLTSGWLMFFVKMIDYNTVNNQFMKLKKGIDSVIVVNQKMTLQLQDTETMLNEINRWVAETEAYVINLQVQISQAGTQTQTKYVYVPAPQTQTQTQTDEQKWKQIDEQMYQNLNFIQKVAHNYDNSTLEWFLNIFNIK